MMKVHETTNKFINLRKGDNNDFISILAKSPRPADSRLICVAAGLDWFCRHVKAKAVDERYDAGVSGAKDWVQQLTDVASVCDQWLESLA